MRDSDVIVKPVCTARTPVLGPSAVMAASEMDLQALQDILSLPDQRRLYMSRLYYDAGRGKPFVLAGPMMGAPYAAMLLEILHAWGTRNFVFFGWCGSIRDGVATGDIIIPSGAFIEEGTSPLYQQAAGTVVRPDSALTQALKAFLQQRGLTFREGPIWSTDGVFRETPAKVKAFREQGALAVEMEMSALFSVAAYHGIALSGVLAVSDELSSLCWRPGFTSPVFLETRRNIVSALADWIERKSS